MDPIQCIHIKATKFYNVNKYISTEPVDTIKDNNIATYLNAIAHKHLKHDLKPSIPVRETCFHAAFTSFHVGSTYFNADLLHIEIRTQISTTTMLETLPQRTNILSYIINMLNL